MEKWIKNITGVIPHTNNNVNIELEGRNLIVTGTNGSGKTSFLRAVYEKANLLIAQKQGANLPQIKQTLKRRQDALNQIPKGTTAYDIATKDIKFSEAKLNAIESGLQVVIPENFIFSSLYDDRKAVIRFFEEKRLSEITQPSVAKAVSLEEEDAKKQNPSQKNANKFEQHLVNLTSRKSLAITIDKNQELAGKIDSWFQDFEKSLKILFEDESITLRFDSDKFKFFIRQENKPEFTFQTLSAGYRAIFDIYAELIMHTEYFKVMPTDLTGVAFIDEIDSHLHVSLQRLIFPFFARSFPKIQFIVTTHSPFVLMSAVDTVVFDLANSEPITDDLSYYTYSAIMKGLWNVKPISVKLENSIKEIARIVNSEQKDLEKLQQLVNYIKGHELDSESKAFYLPGLETLEEGGYNV
ncbi:MAG: ATP-binding protein [Prevotella sp.]|jgi:predicted ATP-binding protein involved in virulence|nr:ATP-binding protein [Prevotella sp.]